MSHVLTIESVNLRSNQAKVFIMMVAGKLTPELLLYFQMVGFEDTLTGGYFAYCIRPVLVTRITFLRRKRYRRLNYTGVR